MLKQTNEPIYLKVIENLKMQILNGILKPDEKIPSVRELALNMMVNPNTIQKAYTELERDGFIYVVIGKGNFVTSDINSIKKNYVDEKMEEFKKVTKDLLMAGVSNTELVSKVKEMEAKR